MIQARKAARATASAAVVLGIAGVGSAHADEPDAQASDVTAMSCSHAHHDTTTANARASGSINIRIGPHAGARACDINGVAHQGHRLGAHCWTINEAGVRWVYVRNKTPSPDKLGWVRGNLIRDELDGPVGRC